MAPPLWPEGASPGDEDLLHRPAWGALFDRWSYTCRCFLHRLVSTPERARVTAHRLILTAASGHGEPGYPGFERALCDEVLVHLAAAIGPAMRQRAALDPRVGPLTNELLALAKRDQLLLLHYDFDERTASSRHDDGCFRATDLARLWNRPEMAVRDHAHAARRRLHEALASLGEVPAR